MRHSLRLSAFLGALTVASAAHAELIYGVTFDNQLVTFDSATPSTITSGAFLDGLQGGEAVAGIDFRPSTGQLYVLGTSSRLYTADLASGTLTQVGPRFAPTLNGATFGVGFNPVADRLRITSDTEQNLRVNPITGAVTVDTSVTVTDSAANPEINAVAYTNDRPGATTTTLYGLNSENDTLVVSTNPNGGTFTTVGSLGMNVSGTNGFDISGQTGIAYLAAQMTGSTPSTLVTVNLATGATTPIGGIGSNGSITAIRALAVAPVPEPATFAALGLGLAALARRRRRA